MFILALLFFSLVTLEGCGSDSSVGTLNAYNDPGASTVSRQDDVYVPAVLMTHTARDRIPPVYKPSFTAASASGLRDDEGVLGIVLNNDSRAYPVHTLKARGIVNDVVGGIPILVSW